MAAVAVARPWVWGTPRSWMARIVAGSGIADHDEPPWLAVRAAPGPAGDIDNRVEVPWRDELRPEVAVLPSAAKGSKAFVRGGADGIHGGLLRAVRHHLRPFGAGLLSPSATERPDQVGRGGPQPSRLIAPDLVAEIGDAVVQPASCVERGTTIAGG